MKKESNLIFNPASVCTISLSPYAFGKEYEKNLSSSNMAFTKYRAAHNKR